MTRAKFAFEKLDAGMSNRQIVAKDTPDGRHLIFPSQYRRERPIPSHPEIFAS